MAGILNKSKDPEFQDISDNIVDLLSSKVLGLSQIIRALNSGTNREKNHDSDILKILDKLTKEGSLCSREIKAHESKENVRIYWLTSQQKSVSPTHVSEARTPSVRTSACTTPKNTPTFRSRSVGFCSPTLQFVSPVIKRSCDETSQESINTPKRPRYDKQEGKTVDRGPLCDPRSTCLVPSLPSSNIQCNKQDTQMLTEKRDLVKTIQDKEEILRKLNLVKVHRSKNDLKELQVLIDKWRNVSQDAAERLLSKVPFDPRPTMGQLLSNLQVDKELIHYCDDDDEEGFY